MPPLNSRPAISVPELANTSGFPGDWMPSSACVHIVLIIFLLLIPSIPYVRDSPIRERPFQETQIHLSRSADPAPLASVQSSSSSSRASASANEAAHSARSSAAGSNSVLPVVFKGPQHVVSDTPDADNAIQTILQPDVLNPPRIHAPIPVPSIVRIATPQRPPSLTAPHLSATIKVAAPPVQAPAPAPPVLAIQHTEVNTVPLTSQTALVDTPKLPVFATVGRAYAPPKQPPPPPAPPNPVSSAPQPAPNANPGPPELIARPNTGQDAHNLLVANAIEVHALPASETLPEVEIHGRFEVSSNARLSAPGATAPPDSKAGSGGGAGSGHGAGTSKGKGAGSGSGPGNSNSAGGNTPGAPSGHGGGTGSGSGTTPGSGSGHGASGSGNSASGNGAGTGSGSGVGTGNQPSPFAGITITGGVHSGGSGGSGLAIAGRHDADPPKHGSYGMTIISSGSSGGGLRDFGVFNDGPVYTVYIDVSTIGIQGTRWSLQYGTSRDVRLAHPGVLLSPPFPDTEKLPHLPPELVASNMGRLLVVQAVLNPEGALEALHVIQSPDERLNPPLLASLSKWTFQAAAMGSDKVPVKILIGIPIAAPMATAPDTGETVVGQALRESPPRTSAQ